MLTSLKEITNSTAIIDDKMINTMDIEAKIKEKRDRITEIDNQIKTLREERKQCVVTASKLETALEHVTQILGEKAEIEEIPQNSLN